MLEHIFKEEKETLAYLLVAVLVILSVVSFVRFTKQETFSDTETYYHIRVAKNMTSTDELSMSKRLVFFSITDYVTKIFLKHEFILWMLPVLLGVLSIFLLYHLFNFMKFSYLEKNLSLIILILSPSFVKTFTAFTNMTLVLPLFFLFFYFLVKAKHFIAYILLIIIALTYYPAALALLLFLIIQIILFKNHKKEKIYLTISTITLVIFYFLFYQFFNLIEFSLSSFNMFVAEFGNYYSISTFAILLALIGVFSKKINNQTRHLLIIWIITFGSFSLLFPNLIHLLALAIVVLATEGTLIVYNHEWELKMLKNLTIMLIIYGLLFSYLSSANSLIYQTPDKEMTQVLKIANTMGLQQGVVLSSAENGFLIQKTLNLPTMLDEYQDYPLSKSTLLNDSSIMFYSRNSEQTKNYLNKYNIKYILITKKMREGQTWSKPDQGMLFLLLNSENFKSILIYQDTELWEYKG